MDKKAINDLLLTYMFLDYFQFLSENVNTAELRTQQKLCAAYLKTALPKSYIAYFLRESSTLISTSQEERKKAVGS